MNPGHIRFRGLPSPRSGLVAQEARLGLGESPVRCPGIHAGGKVNRLSAVAATLIQRSDQLICGQRVRHAAAVLVHLTKGRGLVEAAARAVVLAEAMMASRHVVDMV